MAESDVGRGHLEKRKVKESIIHKHPSPRHLYLCRVRCNFATDDVFFPFLLAFSIRATWIFVAAGTLVYLILRPGCLSLSLPIVLFASIIGFTVIQLAGIFNDLIIMGISNLGSLAVSEPRKKVEIFIYIALFIYLFEIGWDGFSTYTVFSEPVDSLRANCTSYATAVTIYKVVVLLDWGVLAAIFVVFFVLLDPLGCCLFKSLIRNIEDDLERARIEADSEEGEIEHRPGVHKNYIDGALWLHRCRRKYCQCCRRGGLSNSEQDALGDVVRAFGVLFCDVDFTFTDVLSGFRLALVYHRRLKSRQGNSYWVSGGDPTEEMRSVTVRLLKDYNVVDSDYEPPAAVGLSREEKIKISSVLKVYLDYAMAAYGWPVHVYLNPCTGPVSLCISARCNCCCARCQLHQFDGDTGYPNPAAIKAIAGVPEDYIIDASFVNSVHIVPFYVALDHVDTNRKEVIIAVRGTFSIKDVLTDVSVSMEKVEDGLLDVKPCFVHRGFYEAAKGIYNHIMAPTKHHFRDLLEKNYRIVLTGHSLGAAVASVLAVLFKDRLPEKTKDLKAYTFSTPGAVFDYQLAKKTEPFIVSVVGGNDMVPRMTMRGLAYLKMSVSDLIEKCGHTKQRVLCCTGCCGWRPTTPHEPDLLKLIPKETALSSLHSLDLAIDETKPRPGLKSIENQLPFTSVKSQRGRKAASTKKDLPFQVKTKLLKREKHKTMKKFTREFLERLVDLEAELKGEKVIIEEEEEERPMMFIPGRILHLEEGEEYVTNRYCGCRKRRKIIATWKSKEDFSAIHVHTSMLLDHGPSRTVDFINHFFDQTCNSWADDNLASGSGIAMATTNPPQDEPVPRQRVVTNPF